MNIKKHHSSYLRNRLSPHGWMQSHFCIHTLLWCLCSYTPNSPHKSLPQHRSRALKRKPVVKIQASFTLTCVEWLVFFTLKTFHCDRYNGQNFSRIQWQCEMCCVKKKKSTFSNVCACKDFISCLRYSIHNLKAMFH